MGCDEALRIFGVRTNEWSGYEALRAQIEVLSRWQCVVTHVSHMCHICVT